MVSKTILIYLLVAALLLPVAVCVALAVSQVLLAMQDTGGAAVVGRIALGCGILWLQDLVVLAIALGVNSVTKPNEPPEGE